MTLFGKNLNSLVIESLWKLIFAFFINLCCQYQFMYRNPKLLFTWLNTMVPKKEHGNPICSAAIFQLPQFWLPQSDHSLLFVWAFWSPRWLSSISTITEHTRCTCKTRKKQKNKWNSNLAMTREMQNFETTDD